MSAILDVLSGALPFVIRGLANSTSGLLPALVYSATDFGLRLRCLSPVIIDNILDVVPLLTGTLKDAFALHVTWYTRGALLSSGNDILN